MIQRIHVEEDKDKQSKPKEVDKKEIKKMEEIAKQKGLKVPKFFGDTKKPEDTHK